MGQQELTLHLGEQLTGLSPTVCRRIIAAIRETDEKLGGDKRHQSLPTFCEALLHLLGEQTRIESLADARNVFEKLLHVFYRSELLRLLGEVELFLDIVEGKSSTK